jgi:DNA-binding CsgD family transcriptional regulator
MYVAHFTDIELKIIRLICEEKTSKEISQLVFLSQRTIEKYRMQLIEKMSFSL